MEHVYLWDETVYLASAENLWHAQPYYTEIYFRPPLLPFLMHLFSQFGNIEFGAHLIVAFFFMMGIIGIFLLGKALFNNSTGVVAALLFGLNPFLIHQSGKIMTDVPSATLLIFAFYFLFKFFNKNKNYLLWLSGITFGLAVLMRFTSLILLPIVFVALYKHYSNKHTLWSHCRQWGISMFVTLLPYLLWAQLKYKFFLLPFIKAQIVIGSSTKIVGLGYYGIALYYVGGLCVVLGLLLYLIKKIRSFEFTSYEKMALLWVLFLIAYLTLGSHKELRYIIPVLPALFLLSAIGFTQAKNNLLKLFLFALLIATLIFPYYYDVTQFNNVRNEAEPYLLNRSMQLMPVSAYIKENLPENNVVYAHTLYALIGYYSKKPIIVSSPWDERFYKKFPGNMPKNGWYIYFKDLDVSKAPTKEWIEENPHFKFVKEFDHFIIYQYTVLTPAST